jgi:hypothetical protein
VFAMANLIACEQLAMCPHKEECPMATPQQEIRVSPPSSGARGALRPGSYQVGDSVGRVSAVLNDADGSEIDCGGATAVGQRQ